MRFFESIFATIGMPFVGLLRLVESFGHFVLFHLRLLPLYVCPPYRFKELLTQIETIGIGSLGIILLSSIFTGMVLAIQFYHGFHRFGAEDFMSYPIFLAINRELGPVFAGLMVVSRAISAMAAELGSMRVNEQIDAIDLLGIDSRQYLIVPRVLGSAISMPILVLVFDVVGNLAAFIIATIVLEANVYSYQTMIQQFFSIGDLSISLLKALVFGILISLIGSYVGFQTKGGAKGVGQATINAVVYSAVTIFGANYLLSALFLALNL